MNSKLVVVCLLYVCSLLVTGHTLAAHLPLELNQQWYACSAEKYSLGHVTATELCTKVKVPGNWEEQGYPNYDGYMALQTHFTLFPDDIGLVAGIYMEQIRDADKLFLNGHLIGSSGEFLPHFKKATLYSRLYQIRAEHLAADGNNQLTIWVYNNARNGGVHGAPPVIDDYFKLQEDQQARNYEMLIFITILMVFTIVHSVYFIFHTRAMENLYYALFTGSWSLYLLSYSELILMTGLDINIIFRTNVALFYVIFVTFPLFIYSFFGKPIPTIARYGFIYVTLNIPFVMIVPNLDWIYVSLELIETIVLLLTLPPLLYTMYQAIKEKLEYSKILALVVAFYLIVGVIDIYLDYTQGSPKILKRLMGPYALLILSVTVSAILSHKHWKYYKWATFDQLTGLLQRTPFIERLTQEIYRSKRNNLRLLIIMFDLDNFKMVNDCYGHYTGDKVLQKVAEVLQSDLRLFDNVARFGGDEFCISALLDIETNPCNFVERLHKSIESIELKVKEDTVRAQATFGVVEYNSILGNDPEQLLTLADDQLITAKANRKGTVLWFQEPVVTS
ncbi:GGDEF domain-containing protein [Pleionea sp. CnH1-48]|uniref:GGDEF domain-containing protein n=1 Tax=Pleionea sp. CnH1-48 TaxID=2954494 RepID=UPI002096A523|nr:GGDEF domain-containing protein [Pleionea sp. CnH1-48]MCO7226929.1 GGDEF domain-containing protein [Pleionea sp. CnH1-48]